MKQFTVWENIIYFIVGCAGIVCASEIILAIANVICGG